MTFAKVLTSPLQRASKTCALAGFGSVAEVDRGLVEWNYGSTSLRSRGNPVTAQNVSNGLIRQMMAQIGHCDHSPSPRSLVPFAPPELPTPVKPWGDPDTAGVWSRRTS